MHLTGAVDGDAARFTAVFPDLYARCYRVAFRILGNSGEAEEAAQEALSRAFARWGRIESDPLPWCLRVTGNLAIDGVRARARRQRRDIYLRQHLYDGSRTPSPERAVNDRLLLGTALAGLSRRQRQVVVLRHVADLPEAQVAQLLSCSVGSVKSHGARGLAALRHALAGADVVPPAITPRPHSDQTPEG